MWPIVATTKRKLPRKRARAKRKRPTALSRDPLAPPPAIKYAAPWTPPPRARVDESLTSLAIRFGWLPKMPLSGPLSDADIEAGDQRVEAWLRLQRAKRDAGCTDDDRQIMGTIIRRLNAVISNIHPDDHPHGASDLRLLVIERVVSAANLDNEPDFYVADFYVDDFHADVKREAWRADLVGEVIARVREFAPEHATMLDRKRDTVRYAMDSVREGRVTRAVVLLNRALGADPATAKSAAQTFKRWARQRSKK